MKRIFVAFALLFSGLIARADMQVFGESTELNEDVSCYDDTQRNIDYTYCVSKTLGSTNPDVIFEFHGIGENQNSWIKKERNYQIRQAWRNLHVQAPIVVSVSFGRMWLLAERNSADDSGLFEFFRDIVYPRLNAKVGGGVGARYLLGASMGGFNASQLFLKSPALFSRVALICPIINDMSPFATDDEVDRYIDETGADRWRVALMTAVAQNYYGTAADYDKAYPLKIGEHSLGPNSPSLYMSVSHEDPYGIFKGVEKFKDLAIKRGVPTRWKATHGAHCTIDATDVARFFAPTN